jgi:cobalt-zinc-cadmium efflux system protein
VTHTHKPPTSIGRAFGFGIALNLTFLLFEAGFGVMANSTALLADAAHNLGDVLGLVLAWGATAIATRPPTKRHTYGLRRATVLAGVANAVLLLTTVGAVAWESIGRLRVGGEAQSMTMMLVAAVGVVVNAAAALLFFRGSKSDLNVRGVFLHLATDAIVSLGVVGAGLVLWKTGWQWVDPVTSLLISGVILFGTWGLLRDALHLALDGVPKDVNLEGITAYLAALPEVVSVHDLHVWAMSTTEVALTAHLVIPWRDCPPPFLAGLEEELHERFGVEHTTVQLEAPGAASCGRAATGSL